jgi:isocitrate dehydrogenase kinase/phosphatase
MTTPASTALRRTIHVPAGQNPRAQAIAGALIDGFDRHYRIFREMSRQANRQFEQAAWTDMQRGVRDRIQFYDDRVRETVARLRVEFLAESLDDETWQQAKLLYIGQLIDHKQPELAETFFNSVFCSILHRTYFNNDFIFVRPAISTDYIESDPPTYRTYYPAREGLRATLRQIFTQFEWRRGFADLDRDVEYVLRTLRDHLGSWPATEPNCQVQVLASPFYRNTSALVIGIVVNGHHEYPFAIPVLHDERGRLYLDTVLLDAWRIGVLFSLTRAYFLVDMEVPSGYVAFLQRILPDKPRSELYTMLGLAKQGKTMFYRDLIRHLRHSDDRFIVAPGIRGLVMLVFTMPSFPYVFKVIRDVFGPSKDIDRATVERKYLLVKQHDRVGRMADTLEFSDVALPRDRFDPALIDELRREVPSLLEEEADMIVIQHLYIERRMEPLNIHLEKATDEQVDEAIRDYGCAIRELAAVDIFPGDMLYKNFGYTRYDRIVFYDYDEIEYLSDCRFRTVPPAPYPELELAGEAWYPVARNDIFPEEFATFLLGDPRIRKAFLAHNADLLDVDFWRQAQDRARSGCIEDFFPYPAALRFRALYGDGAAR